MVQDHKVLFTGRYKITGYTCMRVCFCRLSYIYRDEWRAHAPGGFGRGWGGGWGLQSHLLNTPPNREALRHSGGDSLLCTSPTVTLYLEVELSSDRRPGTEQNTSLMLTVTPPIKPSLPSIRAPMFLGGMGTEKWRRRVTHTVLNNNKNTTTKKKRPEGTSPTPSAS